MQNKKILIFSLLFACVSVSARAEFSFSCGENREKGAQGAEIGFVDSLESIMKLYLKGVEQPDERTSFKPTDDGQWSVSQDLGEKDGQRSWEFSVSAHSVQEYFTNAKGKTRKIGGPQKCDYKQVKAEPAHP